MILTEKAKEDFLNWVGLNEDMYLCSHSEREIEYMQIEWLDSVGIYIEVNIWHREIDRMYFGWYISDFEGYLRISHDKIKANTRQEATKQAIIKANEIYNNR